MKIEQKKEEKVFIPITVTLHTESDTRIFWDMLIQFKPKDENTQKMSDDLSNWFSNEAKL